MGIPKAPPFDTTLQRRVDDEGFSLYNPNGIEVFRAGHIGGRKWGGAAFTIPGGTYGVWGDRSGVWFTDDPVVVYSMYSDRTFTGPSQTIPVATTLITATIDETLPFGNLIVPSGRVVVPYVDLYSAVLTGPGAIGASTSMKLQFSFFASLNGAAAATYSYLTGPVTTGLNTWSAVKFRTIWYATMIPLGAPQTGAYTVQRNMGLRIFNHAVHALPTTVAETAFTTATTGAGIGRDPDGGGADPGGGSGTAPGGGGGTAGGGGGDLA